MDIVCPICKKELTKYEKSYKCLNNHNFDIAKQGYLNLNMHNSQTSGDNPLMINARNVFLNNGHYDFLLNEINKHLNFEDKLVDLACGEGYYTSRFIPKDKIGIELSKQGLKIASRNDSNTLYLLNSIFHNPLKDKCADKVITIFAPIAKEEINRILKDDSEFILVKPDVYHLYELKEVLYEKPYLNEIENIEIEGLNLSEEIKISDVQTLDSEDLNNLFMMTPYFNTTSIEDKRKLENIDSLKITFAFIIDIYKKIN